MSGLYDNSIKQLGELPFHSSKIKIGSVARFQSEDINNPFRTFVILGIAYSSKYDYYTLGVCPKCNFKGWYRFRMPSDVYIHAKCNANIVWYRNGKIEIPRSAQAITQRNKTGVRALDEILNSDDRIQEVSGDYNNGFEVTLKDGYSLYGETHFFNASGLKDIREQMDWVETCPNDHYDSDGKHY